VISARLVATPSSLCHLDDPRCHLECCHSHLDLHYCHSPSPPLSSSTAASVIVDRCRCHRRLPPLSSSTAADVIVDCCRCHRRLLPLSSSTTPSVISNECERSQKPGKIRIHTSVDLNSGGNGLAPRGPGLRPEYICVLRDSCGGCL
jgi:hypothetical protein